MKFLITVAVLALANGSYGQFKFGVVRRVRQRRYMDWLPSPFLGPVQCVSSLHRAHGRNNDQARSCHGSHSLHYLHESDGLRAKREYRSAGNGCPGEYETPGCDAAGQDYYGRGYIQLTWCYNYRAASTELYGNDWMVYDADAVARDEYIAWDTAFWFWKTNVHYLAGVAEGRFGVTTRAINGGLECDGAYQDIARKRFQMYLTVRSAFGVSGTADERGCYN